LSGLRCSGVSQDDRSGIEARASPASVKACT
jgi:hypothetical protein